MGVYVLRCSPSELINSGPFVHEVCLNRSSFSLTLRCLPEEAVGLVIIDAPKEPHDSVIW